MGPAAKATRGTPLFRVIADDLRAHILDGTYAEGERLPSESELLTQYGSARMTVRQAIEVLRSEGLVTTAQGKGAFVRNKPQPRRLRSGRFVEEPAADVDAETVHVELLELAKGKATTDETERLGLRKGQLVLRRRLGRFAPDGPLELATHVVSASIARSTALEHDDPGPGGIYARLVEAGHAPERFVEEISARMPLPSEQEKLRLSPGTPVLQSIRTALGADERPLELCTTVMAADRYVLEYELPL